MGRSLRRHSAATNAPDAIAFPYARLRERDIELIAADSPGSFQDDGPTARLVRQVLGAVAEFDKAMTVAKLRGARERMRKIGRAKTLDGKRGKCEGRKALYEMVPEAVLMAKRLRRASPLNGERVSLQNIAERLAEAGHINERGKPYNRKSVLAMVNGPRPKGPMWKHRTRRGGRPSFG